MKKKNIIFVLLILLAVVFLLKSVALAQELKPYLETLEAAKKGMTLWELIVSGGAVMVILAILSVATVAIIIYCFISLREDRLVPEKFSQELIGKLRRGDFIQAREFCRDKDNLIAQVAFAGFEKSKQDPYLVTEAMEHRSKELSMGHWKVLSYLSDIATIAPLLGLLGTILGMIQAFNVIALQTAIVKPILLAGGVSKAMITTAGGLIVGIPGLAFYSFFRMKLQSILHVAEYYVTDIMRLIVAGTKKPGGVR